MMPTKNHRKSGQEASMTNTPNPKDIYVGSRGRSRSLMLRMTKGKLVEALGITFQQVQKYEKGTNRVSASKLQLMSHILQVPVTFFFEGLPEQSQKARGTALSPDLVTAYLATTEGL